jgi:uncharacterized protein (TIGR02452 family)
MNRYKAIAEETLKAFEDGKYDSIADIEKRSVLYKSWESSKISPGTIEPKISVTLESSLGAARRLVDSNPCVLNFASAHHPGGGFLWGAVAQEESLARSSGLYYTLLANPDFYEDQKKADELYYTHYAIYSYNIPVVRRDNGEWLDKPYNTNFVTCAAPNRGAFPSIDNELDKKINKVFAQRIDHVLKIMAIQGHKTIILGAWGCGVFGNDPKVVVELFEKGLENNKHFDNVVFAIYDSPESAVYVEFKERFIK